MISQELIKSIPVQNEQQMNMNVPRTYPVPDIYYGSLPSNSTIIINITEPNEPGKINISSDSTNTYPANQTIAGMKDSVPSLGLEKNEAVMSLTVDNFWIVDRTPATEEERQNQPKVVLGKNRGTELTVNGQGTDATVEQATALLGRAQASVAKASAAMKQLQNEENKQTLQAAIDAANSFISQAEQATDEELLAAVNQMGYAYLSGVADTPGVLADSLLTLEQGGLTADNLGKTLGIDLNDLTTFAARSGFTLENLLSFFSEKRLTLQDFSDMLNEIEESGHTIKDFIEAGVLDNEGVGGLVVRLEDSSEGIQVKFTSSSGITYRFCGAVVLSNGSQLQFGKPTDKSETGQQFGEVKMDENGTTCFFSTVYSEELGLFPGEMLLNRYMVIQSTDGNPLLCWIDATGAQTVIGPLKDVDPDGIIAQAF